MQPKRLFAVALLAPLMISCGRGDDDDTQPKPVQTIKVGEPDMPRLVDNTCQQGVADLGVYDVTYWDGQDLEMTEIDLGSWSSTQSLTSSLVKGTWFGYAELNMVGEQCQDRLRPSELMDPYCLQTRQLKQRARALKICQNGLEYSRGSIEGAALTVAGVIDEIDDFFTSLGAEHTLKPLIVQLFPNFEYQTTYEVSQGARLNFSVTDNAAWGRSRSRNQVDSVLYVFPMSEEYLQSRSKGAPYFWEVRWITAHEFGHHAFFNFLGNRSREYFGFELTTLDGPDELAYHSSWQRLKGKATSAENFDLTAINEGFADLFAHYFRSSSTQEMVELDCTFAQRDVASPQLNDGRRKVFANLLMDSRATSRCERVGPDDVHSHGAVFAYFVDRMLELPPAELTDPTAKAHIWAQYLTAFATSLERQLVADGPVILWPSAVETLLDVFAEKGWLPLSAEQCELVYNTFAGLQTSPRQTVIQVLDLASACPGMEPSSF
jgi:hypothetical protein